MTNGIDLIQRLRDEADLCDNDGAYDVAQLLDKAADALTARDELLRQIGDKAHDLSTGPAVEDGYWTIREMAYEPLRGGK